MFSSWALYMAPGEEAKVIGQKTPSFIWFRVVWRNGTMWEGKQQVCSDIMLPPQLARASQDSPRSSTEAVVMANEVAVDAPTDPALPIQLWHF